MSVLEDLLVVQEHDSAADRLRHRRETLPEQARLGEIEQQLATVEASMAELGGRRGEIVRRQQRHEDELASIEAKIGEVDRRLYSGTVSAPRELQAMEADLVSLKRHRSDVEDHVLEAMQDREPLDAELATLEQQRAGLDDEAEQLRQAIAAQTADIDAELATELEARKAAVAGIPEDLLSQYERLRATQGGRIRPPRRDRRALDRARLRHLRRAPARRGAAGAVGGLAGRRRVHAAGRGVSCERRTPGAHRVRRPRAGRHGHRRGRREPRLAAP